MTWKKDSPPGPGEMEFHFASDADAKRHDDAWLAKRAEKLSHKHRAA
jgi:hypothetical protein